MKRLALLFLLPLAACSVAVRATPTGAFPRTWDDEPGWSPDRLPRDRPHGSTIPGPLRPTPAPVEPVTKPAAPATKPAAPRGLGLVAVLPIDARDAKLDHGTYVTLDEFVRTTAGDVLSPRGYTVLTGETTLAVLAENGVDLAKACESSCALQTARELKARLFLSGSIAQSEGAFVAFIRLFDVASGRQLASVSLEGDTVRSLREAFATRAEAFFQKGLDAL